MGSKKKPAQAVTPPEVVGSIDLAFNGLGASVFGTADKVLRIRRNDVTYNVEVKDLTISNLFDLFGNVQLPGRMSHADFMQYQNLFPNFVADAKRNNIEVEYFEEEYKEDKEYNAGIHDTRRKYIRLQQKVSYGVIVVFGVIISSVLALSTGTVGMLWGIPIIATAGLGIFNKHVFTEEMKEGVKQSLPERRTAILFGESTSAKFLGNKVLRRLKMLMQNHPEYLDTKISSFQNLREYLHADSPDVKIVLRDNMNEADVELEMIRLTQSNYRKHV